MVGWEPRPDEFNGREAFFLEMQKHLMSAKVQDQLLAEGRRTGFGGVNASADPNVFRPEWGIDISRPLPVIRFPAAETIEQALALY